jgi:peptidoglycan/xylan/chitin deacetylase (PgdA/CDA1 family)
VIKAARLAYGCAGYLVRTSHRISQGALILLYHRISAGGDPQALSVAPARFAQQMEALRKGKWTPIALGELVRLQQARKGIPRGSVAVTFDDGYLDNLLNARPVLERFDIPATVFVTTGKTGQDTPFWWDELADLLLEAGPLPAVLEIQTGPRVRSWKLDGAENYSIEQCRANRSWTTESETDPSPRHVLYRDLCALLRSMSPQERSSAMAAIREWAKRPAAPSRFPVCDADQLRALADGGLVELGAHTVTHPRLAACTAKEQWNELSESRRALEQITGEAVESCSYPFGSRTDFDSLTPELARTAGYRSACAVRQRHVRVGTNPYRLPRYVAPDWDGERFERLLAHWHSGQSAA